MAAGVDDLSETASTISAVSDRLLKTNKPAPIRAKYLTEASSDVFSLSLDNKPNPAANAQFKYSSYESAEDAAATRPAEFDFKVTDCSGLLHKIRCSSSSLNTLRGVVASKLAVAAEQLLLKYIDEEGDDVLIGSDSSLVDAVDFARHSGATSLKVSVIVDAVAAARITKAAEESVESQAVAAAPAKATTPAADSGSNTTMMLAIGGGVLAVAGIAAFVLTRKNK